MANHFFLQKMLWKTILNGHAIIYSQNFVDMLQGRQRMGDGDQDPVYGKSDSKRNRRKG